MSGLLLRIRWWSFKNHVRTLWLSLLRSELIKNSKTTELKTRIKNIEKGRVKPMPFQLVRAKITVIKIIFSHPSPGSISETVWKRKVLRQQNSELSLNLYILLKLKHWKWSDYDQATVMVDALLRASWPGREWEWNPDGPPPVKPPTTAQGFIQPFSPRKGDHFSDSPILPQAVYLQTASARGATS